MLDKLIQQYFRLDANPKVIPKLSVFKTRSFNPFVSPPLTGRRCIELPSLRPSLRLIPSCH